MVIHGFLASSPEKHYRVDITRLVSAEKGLNLQACGELLKKAKNAEDFEKLLNAPQSKVNNLDLDEDGKVDYINVTEFGDATIKGFSLTTQLPNKEVQEVATIKISKEVAAAEDRAKVQIQGNETLYGRNHYYHTSFSPGLGTGLILGYLWGAHRPYYSPWGYGSYPGHYRPYSTVPYSSYRDYWNQRGNYRDNYTRSTRGAFGSRVTSPNQQKNASSIKAPLKNPTVSQKRFQVRNPSGQIRRSGGGFGRTTKMPKRGGFGTKRGFGSPRRFSFRGK